jgi:flagellar biosynthesis protein FliQ
VNEIDAIDLMQSAIWTVIAVSGPSVIAAAVVGVIVGVIQALTQVQEATLTFVPKIMAVFLASMFAAYWMGAVMLSFATLAYARIESGF